MEESIFSDADFVDADQHSTLGPSYFAARRVVDKAMKAFTDEMLQPLVTDAAKAFEDKLWDHVRDSLWSDTEMNLQGQMWHMVDQIVDAILSGKKWAIDRHALGNRYDHEAVRKAVLEHAPDEFKAGIISDLTEKVAALEKSLAYERDRRF